MSPHEEKRRVFFLVIFFGGFFSWLLFQFYFLIVIENEKWLKIAGQQHYFYIKDTGARGSFFSNTEFQRKHPEKPQPLVFDIEIFHLFADPLSISQDKKSKIADAFAPLLGINRENILKSLEKKSRSRRLKNSLSLEQKEKIQKFWEIFSKKEKIPHASIFFVRDFCRSYPFGKLLGQVLHTVRSSKDPKGSKIVPTGGLELSLDRFLRGKDGKRRLMRSPLKYMELPGEESTSEKGADVYLTINHALQAIAEEELEKGVQRSEAKSGFCLIMDPKNGAILALAEYPFFYPEKCETYFSRPETISQTRVRAALDAFEPGSTMKPITLALALLGNIELRRKKEPPLFDPDAKMDVSSGYFAGRTRPITDVSRHHFLNADMAMQKSSNIYSARLAERIQQRLGAKWYRSRLHEIFGIGKKTGIELPAESKGVLPVPGKKHPNGTLEWSLPTPYSLAMGYNLQVTGIQLAAAHAILANGGYKVHPHLVKKIIKGNETLFISPEFKKKVLPDKVVKRTTRAMRFVTLPGGTAVRANVYGYTEEGKSSTVYKASGGGYQEDAYRASFLGWVPVKNPELLILVMLDEPKKKTLRGVGKNHHGGIAAAPIFRRTARRALLYLGINPDNPFDYPKGDPKYAPEKVSFYEETRKLREMYESWNNKSS